LDLKPFFPIAASRLLLLFGLLIAGTIQAGKTPQIEKAYLLVPHASKRESSR